MIPSGYKEDKVYSVVPSDGSGDLSFTRASNGTRVNSAGLVEVCPWNLILQSETFNNSYWNKVNGTITSDSIVAPNGTTTADLFTITNNSAFVEKTIAGTGTLFTFIPNTQYTFSCYFKKGSIDYNFKMLMYDGVSVTNSGTINLTTPSSSTVSYEDVGNGWYRFYHTFTSSASATTGYFYAVNYDYSTTITSGTNVYLWGAQVVQGATAKPYFPTTDRLNVPRLTYQNGGGGCPSLLLEKQSTNLITYSEQFDDAAWLRGDGGGTASVSVTANYGISPDGTQNADRIQVNKGNTGYAEIYQLFNTTIGTTYTQTMWLKSLSGTPKINFGYTGSTRGTITLTTEWQRYTFTYASGGNPNGVALTLFDGFDPTTAQSIDVLAWGAQAEESSYATSYIQTQASSATRVADACFKTGISSLIGQSQGTMFADFVILGTNGIENRFSISDGSTNNWIFMATPEDAGNGGSRFYIRTNGTTHVDVGSSNYFTIGQRYKLALAYKSGDWAIYGNGNLLFSGTTPISSTSSSFATLNFFNSSGGSAQIGEQINQAILFPTRLTNAELASLTTI